MIRHKAVRNDRKRLLTRRALKLLDNERDMRRMDEPPPALMRTHREEIAVRAGVVEGTEVFGIAEHSPVRSNVGAA